MAAGHDTDHRRPLHAALLLAAVSTFASAKSENESSHRPEWASVDDGHGKITFQALEAVARSMDVSIVPITTPPKNKNMSLKPSEPLSPDAEVGKDGAYKDCPCVNHLTQPPFSTVLIDRYLGTDSSGKPILSVTDDRRKRGFKFARDYGSGGCKEWDKNAPYNGCDNHNPPMFCNRRWCFVDSKNCKRPDLTHSGLFESMYYSYATCGNTGRDSFYFGKYLLPIYAADMIELGIPSRPSMVPEQEAGRQALKVSLMFAIFVLEKMGYHPDDFKYRALSNASMAVAIADKWGDPANSSMAAFTACVHDVSIGNLDMCLGDFWWSRQRAELSNSFFVPVFKDSIRLIVPPVEESFWTASLRKPFAPFSWWLWVAIISTLALSSVFMIIIDRQGRSRREASGDSIYDSLMSLVTFSSTYEPVTISGKILGVSVALFLTIVGASFTANTASFFIAKYHETVPFHTLQEMLDLPARYKVCVDPFMDGYLQKYKRYKDQWVHEPSDESTSLRNGECQGKLVFESGIREAHGEGELCDCVIVGQEVREFLIGFYVSQKIVDPMSIAVGELITDGTRQRLSSEMYPKSQCDTEEEDLQVTAVQFLGPNLIVLFGCAVALAVHYWGVHVERHKINVWEDWVRPYADGTETASRWLGRPDRLEEDSDWLLNSQPLAMVRELSQSSVSPSRE